MTEATDLSTPNRKRGESWSAWGPWCGRRLISIETNKEETNNINPNKSLTGTCYFARHQPPSAITITSLEDDILGLGHIIE